VHTIPLLIPAINQELSIFFSQEMQLFIRDAFRPCTIEGENVEEERIATE
jgi:hypothetical protein